MISYIQKRAINFARIEHLLGLSKSSNQFSNDGPVKRALEKKTEEVISCPAGKRVVCVSSGTAALHLLLLLLSKQKGNISILTHAFNFPSVCVNGLKPTIVDIDLDTYSIPLDSKGRDNISCHDVVVLPTLFGTFPLNLEDLEQFCRQAETTLILDNASSSVGNVAGRQLSSFGDYSFGSFHHTKYLGFGEGGFIVCDEADYECLNALANFGFRVDRNHDTYSSNFKMSDISAAFILAHMEAYSLETHLEKQYRYQKASPIFNCNPGQVYGNIPILFDTPTSHLVFRDVGIEANKYYKPLISHPNSSWLYARIVNFPLNDQITDYDIDRIENHINFIRSHYVG